MKKILLGFCTLGMISTFATFIEYPPDLRIEGCLGLEGEMRSNAEITNILAEVYFDNLADQIPEWVENWNWTINFLKSNPNLSLHQCETFLNFFSKHNNELRKYLRQ